MPTRANELLRAKWESLRWSDGVYCPHCGLIGEAWRLQGREGSASCARPGLWKCAGCRKQFTVTVGTVAEDLRGGFDLWERLLRLYCSGVTTARGLHRQCGVTPRTASRFLRRLREIRLPLSGLPLEEALRLILLTPRPRGLARLNSMSQRDLARHRTK